MSSSNERHRVVIVGSGFGGLAAARAVRRAPVDVTVIDRTNHHLLQPLLYQMATGIVATGDIAPADQGHPPPPREYARAVGRRGRRGPRRTGGDARDGWSDRSRRLRQPDRRRRAGQSYFGHDEFGVHAPGLKSIDDALEVRGRIFGAFELTELERNEREAWLTIAVVGAGPTGVEVAGQIAEVRGRSQLPMTFQTTQDDAQFTPQPVLSILALTKDNQTIAAVW